MRNHIIKVMKRLLLGLFFCTCLILMPSCTNDSSKTVEPDLSIAFKANPQPVPEQEVKTLTLGSEAPAFRLIGTDGRWHELSDYAEAEALVLIFTCNHCPTAQAYEDRMIQFNADYKDKSVQTIAISPNSPLGLLYEELGYSDLNDDYEDMIKRVEEKKYNFPYLYDGDDHKASLQYGPVATPHVFVFDKARKLAYVGRLDASEKPGTANAEDLRNAVDAILEGKKPELAQTKTFGCSTKWAWKTAYKTKVDKEWNEKEVNLEMIDDEGIASLKANEESGKLRLINVWATWCGPCVLEYPEFIVLQRMYGGRDFEFVSISADKPEAKEKAHKFLKEKASAVDNYIYHKDDKYALIEAVDSDWNGALPYTLLVDDKGEKMWSHQGEVDFLELKRVIVDHEKIGRVY